MNRRRKRSNGVAKSAKVLPFPEEAVIRRTRVAQARRRIESGWYDRADVRDRLATAVLEEIRGH
jgi:hypothetical protein